MNRLIISIKSGFMFAASALLNTGAEAGNAIKHEKIKGKPNIIFILTDDHRYDLLGITGNKQIRTPNIDKLANEGILFSNAHVTSPISTPSRASIFTGQFERKHGINFNSGTSMSEEAWSLSYPVLLRQNGYYTGYIGKNHVPIGESGYKSGIIEKSFDYWYGGHGHLSFYPKKVHKIFEGAKYDTQVEVLNEGAIDFLSNEHCLKGAMHFLNERPADKPFCLSINFNLPHGAGTSSMKLLESDSSIYKSLYRDAAIALPKNYVEKSDIKTPKLPPDLLRVNDRQDEYNYVDDAASLKERIIRQMQSITGIDGLVGNLRKKLRESGLDNHTVIIFASDHGLMLGEFGLGGKALNYEVCTHIPLIIYDPMSPKKMKGQVYDELVQTIDIAPTMLTYAGVEVPESMQGVKLNDIIKGEGQAPRAYLFTENLWSTPFGNPRCEAVRDKEWKYIRYYKNENLSASDIIVTAKTFGLSRSVMLYGNNDMQIVRYRSYVESPMKGELPEYEELYHLKIDPNETMNLAGDVAYHSKLAEMRKIWETEIVKARGKGNPKVVRWTVESQGKKGEVYEAK